MGAFTSRGNSDVEAVDIAAQNAYRYPPKTGSYFGSHFIMGGERFDMSQPEAYLFGESSDLNFLGSKPVPFPYPAPQGSEPTKTLKSLVNIRKDSLKFVRIPDNEKCPDGDEKQETTMKYNIEFTFDADVRCAITVYYFATEEMSNNQVIYHSRDPTLNSETFHYKRGANQTFMQSTHIVDPNKFPEEEWQYNFDKEVIPVAIHCVVEEEEHLGHAHMTYAVVERSSVDGGYIIKPLKQKQFVDGLCYLLQEIYGIENKNTERSKLDPEDEVEDSGAECVICMSDMRDTLILPCRHLCLCSACAESLRYQASCCPICRSPFRALLQVRAVRRKQTNIAVQQGDGNEEVPVSQEGVPAGYEAITLIEALNGPCSMVLSNPLQVNVDTIGHPPMRMMPPVDIDCGHREKRRSSKRHAFSVETVREPELKREEKKVTEEEKETDGRETPEVVMSDQFPDAVVSPKVLPKKPEAPRFTDQKDGDCVKIVKVCSANRCEQDVVRKEKNVHQKGSETDVMQLYNMAETEVDKEYRLKSDGEEEVDPQAVDHRLSSEDLADDEREDSSDDLGTEPEPDYDDDMADRNGVHSDDTERELVFKPPPSYGRVTLSNESGDELDVEGYQALHLTEHVSMSDTQGSTTEGSSFSSTNSSRILLPQGQVSDDDPTAAVV